MLTAAEVERYIAEQKGMHGFASGAHPLFGRRRRGEATERGQSDAEERFG